MRMDLETADHISSVGTFLLTVLLIGLTVWPILRPPETVPTKTPPNSEREPVGKTGTPGQQKPFSELAVPSLLAAAILISAALHVAASRSKTSARSDGGKRTALPDLLYPHEPAVLIPNHRTSPAHSDYYVAAFASGQEVLFVSVISQHSVKNMQPLLERAARTSTKVRVLTWDPEIPRDRVEAFRSHIHENDDKPDRTYLQIQDAAAAWRTYMSRFEGVLDLEVHTYQSSPVFQGVLVSNRWACIELVPYWTHTDDRPALLLTPQANPSTFGLMWAAT